MCAARALPAEAVASARRTRKLEATAVGGGREEAAASDATAEAARARAKRARVEIGACGGGSVGVDGGGGGGAATHPFAAPGECGPLAFTPNAAPALLSPCVRIADSSAGEGARSRALAPGADVALSVAVAALRASARAHECHDSETMHDPTALIRIAAAELVRDSSYSFDASAVEDALLVVLAECGFVEVVDGGGGDDDGCRSAPGRRCAGG